MGNCGTKYIHTYVCTYTYMYIFQLSDRYENTYKIILFICIMYFRNFFNVCIIVEFDYGGPYSLLIRRLTIGP